MSDNYVEVWTHGACLENGKPGAARAGYSVFWGHKYFNISPSSLERANVSGPLLGDIQTNNRAEIFGAIEALSQAITDSNIEYLRINTVSMYLCRVAALIPQWKAKTGRMLTANGNPVENPDLIKMLEFLLNGGWLKDVKFLHVPVHSENPGMNMARMLSRGRGEVYQRGYEIFGEE